MSFVGAKGGVVNRARPGRRGWMKLIGPVGLLLFFFGVALTMVWQNVRFTQASLEFERARGIHEMLLSDLNARHMKVSREITLSQIEPRARQRLGLVDAMSKDIVLVALGPDAEGTRPGGPGILDQLVPAALARDLGSRTREEEESGAADRERP